MKEEDALIELLERVAAWAGTAALVSDQELSEWPIATVAAMKTQGLLSKAHPATSATCPGCERECVMPVHILPDTTRASEAFIVCDKRSDINRVAVSTEQLTQWRCDAGLVRQFVAQGLGLRLSGQRPADNGMLNIGIISGDKRSQMLSLHADDGELVLVAGNNALPLADVIGYGGGKYSVDGAMIRQLIDSAITSDPRYTPSNARREARKLDTQSRYERWRKAYRELKKQRRNMSDVWCSQQISKNDIAKGHPARNPETIRKHMKA